MVTVKVSIRPAGGDPNQQFVVEAQGTETIGALKEKITQLHPSRPASSQQRLIYAGAILRDEQKAGEVFYQNPNDASYVAHLVLSNPVPETQNPSREARPPPNPSNQQSYGENQHPNPFYNPLYAEYPPFSFNPAFPFGYPYQNEQGLPHNPYQQINQLYQQYQGHHPNQYGHAQTPPPQPQHQHQPQPQPQPANAQTPPPQHQHQHQPQPQPQPANAAVRHFHFDLSVIFRYLLIAYFIYMFVFEGESMSNTSRITALIFIWLL